MSGSPYWRWLKGAIGPVTPTLAGGAAAMLDLGSPIYVRGLGLIVECLSLAVAQVRGRGLATAIAGPSMTLLTERHAVGESASSLLLQLEASWLSPDSFSRCQNRS